MAISVTYSFGLVTRNAALIYLLWISVASAYAPSALFSASSMASPTASSIVVREMRPRRRHSLHAMLHSRGVKSSTAIHGESKGDDDDDDDDLADYGEKVAGIFANLRIPASLIAGAALGSAFGMPMAATDGLKMGTVKRLYTMVMLGTLSSMLLTVLLSTICLADIAFRPPRKAKYVKDYIEKFYALEWMLMKTHFMWGNVVFVLGSMLRGWVFLKCPIIGDGVLGIMGSLMLISVSILLEFNRNQTGDHALHQWRRNTELVIQRMKTNRLFGVAVLTWLATFVFVVVKSPSVYLQLRSP